MKCGLTECGQTNSGYTDTGLSDNGYTDSGSKDAAKGNAAYRNAANGMESSHVAWVTRVSSQSRDLSNMEAEMGGSVCSARQHAIRVH